MFSIVSTEILFLKFWISNSSSNSVISTVAILFFKRRPFQTSNLDFQSKINVTMKIVFVINSNFTKKDLLVFYVKFVIFYKYFHSKKTLLNPAFDRLGSYHIVKKFWTSQIQAFEKLEGEMICQKTPRNLGVQKVLTMVS